MKTDEARLILEAGETVVGYRLNWRGKPIPRMSKAFSGVTPMYKEDGETEDIRRGTSVCMDVDQLAEYFGHQSHPYVENADLVKIKGRLSSESDHEAHRPGSPFLVLDAQEIARWPFRGWKAPYAAWNQGRHVR